MASSKSWQKIFDDYNILEHNFEQAPFEISAKEIKSSVQDFKETSEKEVRILCKMDTREQRPEIMQDNDLFLLPIVNGTYVIIKGEGYLDIPEIEGESLEYKSKLDFELKSSKIGNSEMQHLDFAYANSLIRTFFEDDSLQLTIRGRKYTPKFSFFVGDQKVNVRSVQTEVDAGYEGKEKIVLVEAKNATTTNTIIRQLFYPYKKWKQDTGKDVILIFFEKRGKEYHLWEYIFSNDNDYNSVELVKSKKYKIIR